MWQILLAAAALVLAGALIAWALNPPPPGRHTAEHLSTQPLTVVPDRLVDIGEWR